MSHLLSIFILSINILYASLGFSKSMDIWSQKKNLFIPTGQIPNFSHLASEIIPSVVSIHVEKKSVDRFENYFHRFFGGQIPREYKHKGIGTGFVIHSDGYILTNNHVIESSDTIKVTFALKDGSQKKLSAKVVGTAPQYDVALLKTIEKIKTQVAYLGNSNKTLIGDWVMAVGNPFGLSHSVSVGIISAKERRDIAPSGKHGLYNFLQTDASINPGNSGGPLINMYGEVIGINTAINAQGSGIGFAIPINMVKSMLPSLKEKGTFNRSWIGVKIQKLDQELAMSYGLKNLGGALIAEVINDSPAQKAGLMEGDIILEFDNKVLQNISDLPIYASMAKTNKSVKLKIWRDQRKQTIYLTPTKYPTNIASNNSSIKVPEKQLGIIVDNITPKLAQHFGLRNQKGVLLRAIDPNGPAFKAGLRLGDVILSLNGKPCKRAEQFVRRIKKIKSNRLIRIQISRKDERRFIGFRKP